LFQKKSCEKSVLLIVKRTNHPFPKKLRPCHKKVCRWPLRGGSKGEREEVRKSSTKVKKWGGVLGVAGT